jgi:hypothetical protein
MVACAVWCRKWCYKAPASREGKASLWCVYLAAQKLCGWRMALCRRSRVGVFVVCDKLRMRCCPRVTLRSFTWTAIAVLFTGRAAATLLEGRSGEGPGQLARRCRNLNHG